MLRGAHQDMQVAYIPRDIGEASVPSFDPVRRITVATVIGALMSKTFLRHCRAKHGQLSALELLLLQRRHALNGWSCHVWETKSDWSRG